MFAFVINVGQNRALIGAMQTCVLLISIIMILKGKHGRSPVQRSVAYSLKLSAQRKETGTKQFQNSFKAVFQFHVVVQTVLVHQSAGSWRSVPLSRQYKRQACLYVHRPTSTSPHVQNLVDVSTIRLKMRRRRLADVLH